MAVKLLLISILSVITVAANADGEFSILYSPDSLEFKGSSVVPETALKEIFSASLGLSVVENSDWDGLSISNPFKTPEAVVEVYIDGVSSLGSDAQLKARNYPLVIDEYEPDAFDAVKHRIEQRYSNGGNRLVNIKLSDINEINSYSDVFGAVKPAKVLKKSLQYLKASDTKEEDYQFLLELENLKAIIEKIKSGVVRADNEVDLYNLRITTLHPLSDFHGPDSPQTKEAKQLLAEALNELSDAFKKAYEGSVLVTVVTSDVAHTRRAQRSVSTRQDVNSSINLAESYSEDYPSIFNIMLWFGVVFAFSLIAIVYALMDMDPGRDSIIYRMTSTRMKKDN